MLSSMSYHTKLNMHALLLRRNANSQLKTPNYAAYTDVNIVDFIRFDSNGP